MKFDFYQTNMYLGPNHSKTWPAPPRLCEPEFGPMSTDLAIEQCLAAHEAGFDSLTFAEHHYSPKQLTPNPVVLAGIVGRLIPGAHIGVFGTDLPLNNPVRIAEEYAMLDNLVGGRLRIGLLRGTPNEYLTYGTNPWESRDRFEEAVLLIMRALSEPEPFGWEGRYFRFRNVSIWPRALQLPHPRILLSGNSKDSARFAGRHGCDIGFSYMSVESCAENLAVYRAAAADAGWEPTADNIQYRQFCFVSEDDAELEQVAAEAASSGGLLALFQGASMDTMAVMGMVGAAMAGVPKHVKLDPAAMKAPLVPAPPFFGRPAAVVEQIERAHAVLGMGHIEVSIGISVSPLPHETVMRTIKLIGAEVLPATRQRLLTGAAA